MPIFFLCLFHFYLFIYLFIFVIDLSRQSKTTRNNHSSEIIENKPLVRFELKSFVPHWNLVKRINCFYPLKIVQSAGTVEYTECFSAEG